MDCNTFKRPEEAKERFFDLYSNDIARTGQIVCIGSRTKQLIKAMSGFMHFDKSSSYRQVFDADERYLLACVGISKMLGLSALTVWQRWYSALGKGNGGIFTQWRGYNIKLCAKKGTDNRFYAARNRREQQIGGYLFVNVEERNDGKVYITPRGYTLRRQASGLIKSSSDQRFWILNVGKLEREGILKPFSDMTGGKA
jgi:hypothetical protein